MANSLSIQVVAIVCPFSFHQLGLNNMADYELEGYQMLELIGEGTYGDVYKVKRIADNKICAIKFVALSSINHRLDSI